MEILTVSNYYDAFDWTSITKSNHWATSVLTKPIDILSSPTPSLQSEEHIDLRVDSEDDLDDLDCDDFPSSQDTNKLSCLSAEDMNGETSAEADIQSRDISQSREASERLLSLTPASEIVATSATISEGILVHIRTVDIIISSTVYGSFAAKPMDVTPTTMVAPGATTSSIAVQSFVLTQTEGTLVLISLAQQLLVQFASSVGASSMSVFDRKHGCCCCVF